MIDLFFAYNLRSSAITPSVNGKLNNCNCGSPKTFNLNETYICPNNGYVHIRNTTNQSGYIILYLSGHVKLHTYKLSSYRCICTAYNKILKSGFFADTA